MLPHRHEVGERLGGVPLIGQTVKDRNGRVLGEFDNGRMIGAAIFDCVENPRKDSGGVRRRLLVSDLARCWIQDRTEASLLGDGRFEGHACARRCLFEDQSDASPVQALPLVSCVTLALEVLGEVHQVRQFRCREVLLGEEIAAP